MSHTHTVTDMDPHFTIDPITRNIIPKSEERNEIGQYDHNSEVLTFEIPRYVEGHDMSLCNVVEIHYLNYSKNKGLINGNVYEVNDLKLSSSDSDTLTFSWLISRNATQLEGTLDFTIRFMCTNSDDGSIEYEWHTKSLSNIDVFKSIVNSQAAVAEYSDVLEEWRQKLFDAQGLVEVADGSITTAKLADGAVTRNKISSYSVSSVQLGNFAVTTDKIGDKAVTTAKLANTSITTEKLADGAVTESKIVDKAVTSNKLADDSVTRDKIGDQAVTYEKLGIKAVGTRNIMSGTLTTDLFADGAVTESKIVDKAVTSNKLADGAVTEAKIVDKAITTSKLGTRVVTAAKLGYNAVTDANIVDGSIIESKIHNTSITTDKLADGAVTGDKIAPGTISVLKFDADLRPKIDAIDAKVTNYTPEINGFSVMANESSVTNKKLTGTYVSWDGICIITATADIVSSLNTITYTLPTDMAIVSKSCSISTDGTNCYRVSVDTDRTVTIHRVEPDQQLATGSISFTLICRCGVG